MEELDRQKRQLCQQVTDVCNSIISRVEYRRKKQDERKEHFYLVQEKMKNIEIDLDVDVGKMLQPRQSIAGMVESNQRLKKMLQQQEDVTHQLQSNLRLMDEDYMTFFNDQGFEVAALRNEIKAATKDMIQMCIAYSQQLELALSSNLEETKQAHELNIKAVLVQRSASRQKVIEEAVERLESFWKDFDDIKEANLLEKREHRKNLEEDIESLQLQLHEMQSSFELKIEEIDHGKIDLDAQHDGKTKKIKCYRKIILREKDNLGKIVADFKETDSKNQRKLKNLTQSFTRSARQFKDVELRLAQSEQKHSSTKQKAVRMMYENDIRSLIVAINNAESLILSDALGHSTKAYAIDDDKLM